MIRCLVASNSEHVARHLRVMAECMLASVFGRGSFLVDKNVFAVFLVSVSFSSFTSLVSLSFSSSPSLYLAISLPRHLSSSPSLFPAIHSFLAVSLSLAVGLTTSFKELADSSHSDHLLMIDWESIEGCWLLLFSEVTMHPSSTMTICKRANLVCPPLLSYSATLSSTTLTNRTRHSTPPPSRFRSSTDSTR